jgi:hypothetical protein
MVSREGKMEKFEKTNVDTIKKAVKYLDARERSAKRTYISIVAYSEKEGQRFSATASETYDNQKEESLEFGRLVSLTQALGYSRPEIAPQELSVDDARRILKAARKAVDAEIKAISDEMAKKK